jgi:hypothetical protein
MPSSSEGFAAEMEAMYLSDLENATEVILDPRHRRLLFLGEPRHRRATAARRSGSAGRAAAGAVCVGNTIGAAFTNRRVLEPIEARFAVMSGVVSAAPTDGVGSGRRSVRGREGNGPEAERSLGCLGWGYAEQLADLTALPSHHR